MRTNTNKNINSKPNRRGERERETYLSRLHNPSPQMLVFADSFENNPIQKNKSQEQNQQNKTKKDLNFEMKSLTYLTGCVRFALRERGGVGPKNNGKE